MEYTVIKIQEDVDFGCEERGNEEVKAVVTLLSDDGNEFIFKEEDRVLYERGISEGDRVVIDKNRDMKKVGEDDW